MKSTGKTMMGRLHLKLLPSLAWKGIISNGNVYYPYLAAGIFSVFTYFVFTSILKNDIIRLLPRSAYAWLMLAIGRELLSVILLLFLIYANGFLVKRRHREFGLYHMLGMEKKHIGSMMFFESVLIYAGALGGGILIGIVLSKLMFLILLRVCRLSVDIRFVFEPSAFVDTMTFFGIVYAINFVGSLWQVGKARPVELMSSSRKGEKEPRFVWFWALLGLAACAGGYYCSVISKVDEMIFINFFMAVFLVVVGTYLLFTSGSVAFLKWMRARKGTYYRPGNFITISGMLYRMKKNAAGLSNICIFSTMVIITLICTVDLSFGMDECMRFTYPYDLTLLFGGQKTGEQEVLQKVDELERKYGVKAERVDVYDSLELPVMKQDAGFFVYESGKDDYEDYYRMGVVTLADYNKVADHAADLMDGEVLIYCSGMDYGYDSVDFYGEKLQVKEEIKAFFPIPKAEKNVFNAAYMMVVKDEAARSAYVQAWAAANGVEDVDAFLAGAERNVHILLAGEDEDKKPFLDEFSVWGQSQPGYTAIRQEMELRSDLLTMYGALLFIGVLFGLIFFMCLILVMYYKQITEGYEDRNNFGIMQKVGMSDREIRAAVRKQILTVFGLPLVGAVLHTVAGMFMVNSLFSTIQLFNTGLLIKCTVGVAAVFVAVYGASYFATARTYYRIVRF